MHRAGSAAGRGLLGVALAVVLGFSTHARAAPPTSGWLELPFAQKLDMGVVHEVTRSTPDRLLATMARSGVDLWVVRSTAPDKPLNPLLSGLPTAPAELVRQAEFRDTYEGRVIPRGAACCGLARDAILIRDTASTYTLLHEFLQSRLVPLDGRQDGEDVELRFTVDFRRLLVYQRRLLDDPRRLLDPLWRRDILVAQTAVADRLFRRIQMGQSQEAIVEKVLCCHIDERSPYFDATRKAQGLGYGEAMIDNAIDLYNTVHDSVTFVRSVVRDLHAQGRDGRIDPDGTPPLSEEDVNAVEAATRAIEHTLSRVRGEIAALKQFYTL